MAGSIARPAVFASALLLAFAFGSLHAFSVLTLPLEAALSSSRTAVSLAYSLAIVAVAVGVYAGPAARRLLPTAGLAMLVGLTGAAGLAIAAFGGSILTLLAGYGAIFGLANGLAYSLFLELAARAMPGRAGLAIGIATATYSLGAMAFSQILGALAARVSAQGALGALAIAIAAAGLVAGLLLRKDEGRQARVFAEGPALAMPGGLLLRLWLIYLFGAAAGLMSIAHMAPILAARGGSPALGAATVAVASAGTLIGSTLGGLWADGRRTGPALAGPLAVAAAASLLLLATGGLTVTVAALTGIATSYGMLITAMPVVIRDRLGPGLFPSAFGRVFTAWGVAGLAGPVLGSALFDSTGSYDPALAAAAVAVFLALILCRIR